MSSLYITSKKKPVRFLYNIHGQTLEEADSAKYLGVTLQNDLNWNKHIDTTDKKANNTRAFLQRNLQQCPRKTKELCYKALVRPIMEYASVIWDPSTDKNIRKLEMVQRRAARMVFSEFRSTSSVTPTCMLQQLQWSTLQERRSKTNVVMMYRIVYHLGNISSCHLAPTISVRGHNMKFLVPYARTSTYQKSFFPDTIRLWNSLPQIVVSCPKIDNQVLKAQRKKTHRKLSNELFP